MEKIKLDLRGDIREYNEGVTGAEVAGDISPGLLRVACAVRFEKDNKDLRDPITSDGKLEILTFDDDFGKHAYWHSSSHLLAHALIRLYPGIQLAIGPSIDAGFYYDVDSEHTFTPDDFDLIEKEMKKIVKENIEIERFSLDRKQAEELMSDQVYKLELIRDLPEGEKISFYRQGDFTDLCAGPHLMRTGEIKSFKLTSVTGAYWRGNSDNKMLQRIYGISFPKASLLNEHLEMIEEAKRRDHRVLGRELGLFELFEEGPGFPVFLPNGMILRNNLIDMWRIEHEKAGYKEISTPTILNRSLWETSGHWDHYRSNMYTTVIDEEDYAIKPMNCPGALLVYNKTITSYRDLPKRICELGLVHRHELSGALHGLMRVRAFTQDDAHIFMTEDQIEDEIFNVIGLVERIYGYFGLEYDLELSTRPENFLGEIEQWDMAEAALENALKKSGKKYRINEGDGAFYGPKIDFHIRDSLGRSWQCATIQLDYQLPERFETEYIGPDGERHRPIMIHRVILGAIERFIAILIEHFAGAFPVWISPVQAVVIPISEKHREYAAEVEKELIKNGVRAECDFRDEKMGYKIRQAQLQKVPYMLIVGQKEMEEGTISLRSRKEGDLGAEKLDVFIENLKREINNKEF
jgi:threonyl-tRNA synthetase